MNSNKRKLCLNIINNGVPIKEQLLLFKKVGFDGFFLSWNENIDLVNVRNYANSLGLYFQSVHAPFGKAADMWRDEEKSKIALDELMRCVYDTAKAGVKIVVCHAWIGFDIKETPNQVGIENYRKLVEYANTLNVNIAFENTEGEEFLFALLNAFSSYKNVGFCLDTGHELCYNKGKDLLCPFGNMLIATHINDNLGVSDPNGKIAFYDDLHLLPFDGKKDWEDFANRIKKCGYKGDLTFELKILGVPYNAQIQFKYNELPFEEYLQKAYNRARRLALLIDN